MTSAVMLDTDLENDSVPVDQLGLRPNLVSLLKKNDIHHFFPGMPVNMPSLTPQ